MKQLTLTKLWLILYHGDVTYQCQASNVSSAPRIEGYWSHVGRNCFAYTCVLEEKSNNELRQETKQVDFPNLESLPILPAPGLCSHVASSVGMSDSCPIGP